jgi:site-specific recombinase XerD
MRTTLEEEKIVCDQKTPQGETPLLKYWDKFVSDWKKEGRSERTVKNVRDKLKFVITVLGIHSIEQCNNPVLLRDKLFEIAEKRNWGNGEIVNAGTTINSYAKDLKTYYIWLEDMQLIKENNLKRFRKCKEKQNEQYTLQEKQIEALQTHITNRKQTHRVEKWRNKLFIELSISTGARPCELEEIQCKDIEKQGDKYVLKIHGHKQKGGTRKYNLTPQIRDIYDTYMYQRQRIGREEPKLFISLSSREGWTYKGMNALMKRLSKELGFRVNSYAIRRFVATKLWKEEKMSEREIMAHLGHTRLSTTLRYVERGSELTQKGVNVMGKMF